MDKLEPYKVYNLQFNREVTAKICAIRKSIGREDDDVDRTLAICVVAVDALFNVLSTDDVQLTITRQSLANALHNVVLVAPSPEDVAKMGLDSRLPNAPAVKGSN